jgi:hypothetical protein
MNLILVYLIYTIITIIVIKWTLEIIFDLFMILILDLLNIPTIRDDIIIIIILLAHNLVDAN